MKLSNCLPYDGLVYDCGQVLDDPSLAYTTLLETLPWQADRVTLFGKTHITQRQLVWMGEGDYHYSGHTRQAMPWSQAVLAIKQQVERFLSQYLILPDATPNHSLPVGFNACLLNYYPSGEAGMGYHADDEAVLGETPLIASLSLGATRSFFFKHRNSGERVTLALASGQLIVMAGTTQQHWRHSLPKTKKVQQGRINLTFRQMLMDGR